MLKIIKKEKLIQDGVMSTKVYGKLIKVYVRVENPLPDVILKIFNQDSEIIAQLPIEQNVINLYPIKESVKGDSKLVDNYYLHPNDNESSNLFIQVIGLKEGQKIDMIKVLYDDTQHIKTSD